MKKEIDYIDGHCHDVIWNPKKGSLNEFMKKFEGDHVWKFKIHHMFGERDKDGNLIYRLIIQ